MANGEVVALPTQSADIMDITGGAGEMKARLDSMKQKLSLVQDFFKSIMEKDLDFGVIPGTDKPTLYKPGAEKLLELYGFAPIIKEKKETRDISTGYYHAELVIQVIHRNTGMIIAEGVGEACSYESKYRYRWVFEREVPNGVDRTALQAKTFERKKDGKEFTKYRIENVDLIDQWNTVLKMAKKRALVDVTLSATRTSGIFSQSEDEMDAWIDGDSDERIKDRLEKKKPKASTADEKADFDPYKADGAADPNALTSSQYGKIIGDAKRKGVDEAGIKAIVVFTKKKTINKLTKSEASAVIEFLAKTDQTELQTIAATAQDAPTQWTPEELGDK